MYRRHESLVSQVTKTADDVPMIVTRLASAEKNDIDYYPFSQVLRIRVLQVTHGGISVTRAQAVGGVVCPGVECGEIRFAGRVVMAITSAACALTHALTYRAPVLGDFHVEAYRNATISCVPVHTVSV